MVAFLLSGAAFANPKPAGAAGEIAALLGEFLAHVDDVAMHERFWADDLVYVSAAGILRNKAAILESVRTGDAKSTYSAEEVNVRPLAADVAVLNFRLLQHEGGKVNHFRNSGTFVKRKGRWQAVSWQATREAP